MAVYVDDMYDFKKYNSNVGQFGRMKMSHMVADTSSELVEMANKIGVNKKWIQYPGTPREHFDICMSKRKLAIKNGAVEITWRQMGERLLSLRKKK
jgi:hypothetical protein